MKDDISLHSNLAEYVILVKTNTLKYAGSSLSHFRKN